MAACPSHRVRNAERSIFPCRRCTVTLCRNRNCFIPRKKVERQSRIGCRNHILITTNRVVSFLRQPVYPRLPAAGFESRRDVCRSSRIHKSRRLRNIHPREHHSGTKSKPAMGRRSRTFFPNCRAIPVRAVHWKKATFCFQRKESPLLDKNLDYLRNFVCTALQIQGTFF